MWVGRETNNLCLCGLRSKWLLSPQLEFRGRIRDRVRVRVRARGLIGANRWV